MDPKASLQLGKITLKNYRTFKGTTVIELSRDREKTITVIEGEMGKGKTTILNAVYWCLYGEFRHAGSYSDENIINNDVLSSLSVGDENDTSVEIHLYEEDELRYKIRRNVHFVKKDESVRLVTREDIDGSLPDGILIEPTVEFSHLPKLAGSSDWIVHTDPAPAREAIRNIFPEPLSSYFLFDAELLDSFFDLGSKSQVKNGIEKISGIPVIDDAIKHMKNTYSDILQDIKNPKTEPLKNAVFITKKQIDADAKIIDEENKNLERINAEMESIRSYLRNNDQESVKEKQAHVDDLRASSKKIREDLSKHEKEMNDWLLYCNTVVRLRGSMDDSLNHCDAWEKEGKIPVAVSGQALKNILNQNPSVCICGTHLDEGSKQREHMKQLLAQNTADSPIIQNITTGRGHWDDMVTETTHSSMIDKLDEYRSTRQKMRSDLEERDAKIKEISSVLKKHDQDEIREKSHRLSYLQGQYDESNGKKAVAENRKRKATLQLEQDERKLDQLLKEESKYHSHHNRRELAKTIEKLLKQYRNDLIEQIRDTVAEKTTDYFLRLVSRNDFSKVEIGPDYSVTASGRTGHSKGLSAGQTCCLALSYIAAIRDIAEKNYFMMIDSPLHNIDQGERVDIAKNLPQFIPGTQITLLVQDQEYVGRVIETEERKEIPSVRDTLKDNGSLWREYKLEFGKNSDADSYNTTVREMSD